MRRLLLILGIFLLGLFGPVTGEIPKPTDAPKPLSPGESARRFKVPEGFRLELLASEPLVREPSGVCWDERGQMFVCELHGYNLEGQYDIEEWNKKGKLDQVVGRFQASEGAKKRAEAETYGTIKLLRDTDGDGRMDRADLWADRLPPCHGICAARGGIIAACQTQILFLADRDGDGKAEVREVLFEGFARGPLERSINCPQWGPDNWIYFGRGKGGGIIRGKYLKKPVLLPASDFRIKADGSAIEPVTGSTQTMGFSFTESGDRFVITTRTPGIFVAPLSWKYLARNPDLAAPPLQEPGTNDQHVYPASAPHPWRSRRAEHPGFSNFYSKRYGIQESAANGYFTSACSPLVYQDIALPGLRGQLLACEPAQNLVHRAVIERDGARLKLRRAPGEEKAEFLTSSDPWFHAIALAHAPDGNIVITDFYREIIEDYSAIPRYLQQQYGLDHGKDRGRIWRLTHRQAKTGPAVDLSRLKARELAKEIASPHYWRRETARRLLVERRAKEAAPILARLVNPARKPSRSHQERGTAAFFANTATVLNALHTLDGLGALERPLVEAALEHPDPAVRRQAVRFLERWLDDPGVLDKVVRLMADKEPMVRLQVALSLGESRQARVAALLVGMARVHGSEPWMSYAILSAAAGRGGLLLAEALRSPKDLGQVEGLLEPLCTTIGNRRHGPELSLALAQIRESKSARLQMICLRGLQSSFKEPAAVELSERARTAVKAMAGSSDSGVRSQAGALIVLLRIETLAERVARLAKATREVSAVQLPIAARLAAVAQLAGENDPKTTASLLAAISSGTPQVREAILIALLGRRERLPALLDALEQKKVPVALLSAVQRTALLEAKDPALGKRAAVLLKAGGGVNEHVLARYVKALQKKRDVVRGQALFREKCAACHQAHGLGFAVGPDLTAEFQRAEETILRDVLAPSAAIRPGYETYYVSTAAGRVFTGLLAAESPTSITLRLAEAKEQVILRRDLDELRVLPVSLMPDDLPKTVTPDDLADLLGWLRRPSAGK